MYILLFYRFGIEMLLKELTNYIKKVYLLYINNTAFIFEFDETKSKTNFTKHGIDFVTAQAMWKDRNIIEKRLITSNEPRYLHIGMISGKLY